MVKLQRCFGIAFLTLLYIFNVEGINQDLIRAAGVDNLHPPSSENCCDDGDLTLRTPSVAMEAKLRLKASESGIESYTEVEVDGDVPRRLRDLFLCQGVHPSPYAVVKALADSDLQLGLNALIYVQSEGERYPFYVHMPKQHLGNEEPEISLFELQPVPGSVSSSGELESLLYDLKESPYDNPRMTLVPDDELAYLADDGNDDTNNDDTNNDDTNNDDTNNDDHDDDSDDSDDSVDRDNSGDSLTSFDLSGTVRIAKTPMALEDDHDRDVVNFQIKKDNNPSSLMIEREVKNFSQSQKECCSDADSYGTAKFFIHPIHRSPSSLSTSLPLVTFVPNYRQKNDADLKPATWTLHRAIGPQLSDETLREALGELQFFYFPVTDQPPPKCSKTHLREKSCMC